MSSLSSIVATLVRAVALASVLAVASVGLSVDSATGLATAAAAPNADHGDGAAGDGDHHSTGPWDDDNHDGTANFLDGSDPEHANSWGHPVYLQWIWHLFNLAVLVGLLVYFGRRGIAAALRDRSLGIKNELESAAGERDQAQGRYQELELRLSRFEDEVATMKTDAQRAVEAERQASVERAEQAAERIREAAERSIRDETHRATVALRTEAVQLAVELAERTLQSEFDDRDRARLATDFLDSVRTQGSSNG